MNLKTVVPLCAAGVLGLAAAIVASQLVRQRPVVVDGELRQQAIENARRIHPQLTYVADLDEALRDADAVIVVTEWDEYRRELDPTHAASLVAQRVIVDGRNCLDAAAWRAAGFTYTGMGRP